jgi:hypothetical protein
MERRSIRIYTSGKIVMTLALLLSGINTLASSHPYFKQTMQGNVAECLLQTSKPSNWSYRLLVRLSASGDRLVELGLLDNERHQRLFQSRTSGGDGAWLKAAQAKIEFDDNRFSLVISDADEVELRFSIWSCAHSVANCASLLQQAQPFLNGAAAAGFQQVLAYGEVTVGTTIGSGDEIKSSFMLCTNIVDPLWYFKPPSGGR